MGGVAYIYMSAERNEPSHLASSSGEIGSYLGGARLTGALGSKFLGSCTWPAESSFTSSLLIFFSLFFYSSWGCFLANYSGASKFAQESRRGWQCAWRGRVACRRNFLNDFEGRGDYQSNSGVGLGGGGRGGVGLRTVCTPYVRSTVLYCTPIVRYFAIARGIRCGISLL